MHSPYVTVLGDAFSRLDPRVQRAHLAPLRAAGALDVHHGAHWLTRGLVALMRLPAAGDRQPVELRVTTAGHEVEWMRQIGAVVLRTRQHAHAGRIVERHGAARVTFDVSVEDASLVYRQASIRVAGIPLPALVSPRVHARVSADGSGWRVDVRVTWRDHLVCRYSGSVAAV
jgi:hypothetical protein